MRQTLNYWIGPLLLAAFWSARTTISWLRLLCGSGPEFPSPGRMVADLELIARIAEPDDLVNRVEYLPL